MRRASSFCAAISCRVSEARYGGNLGGCVSATDIFLSYARHDRPTARVFAETLLEEGFSVWWDASLHSGETFDEVIEQRLRDSKAVVVLWSPRSVASRWVRAEATLADRRNKLVPAIIEPCDRPIVFELTHTAELADWHGDRSDARWQTFVHDLHRMLDSAREREAAAASKPAAEAPVQEAAPPVARQPLRPGSGDVLVATHAPPVQHSPQVTELRARAPSEDEPSAEVHCLETENAVGDSELFVIDSSSLKLGRTPPADIVVPDKSVSRDHCVIGLANDELFVTDLNSTNGTYIDDQRIDRATILPLGSVLRLGRVTLKHGIFTRAEAERRSARPDEGSGGPGLRAAASS